MSQPEGFEDGTNRVCKLLKSLYGLKQSPKSWNVKFTKCMKALNFTATDDDPCLFYNSSRSVIVAVFVDDGIVIGKTEKEINELLTGLAKEFEIKTENTKNNTLYFLGMKISLKKNDIFVNQGRYTKKILEKYDFHEVNVAATPMEPGMMTEKLVNDRELINKPYREVVGSLLYLSAITRPDILFAVN